MAYHVTNQYGSTESEPTVERMRQVLDTINPDDAEHTDVSLTHESEWCLSVFACGLVVFENLEEGEPRHLRLDSPNHALPLWELLARGELSTLEQLPWQPGYG